VAHYCPEETWQIAVSLFEETREAMRARITANAWMSQEAKQKSIAKLDDLVMGQLVPPGGNFDCSPLLADLKQCGTLMDAAAVNRRFYNQCMMRFTGEKLVRGNPYTLGASDLGVLSVGGRYIPGQNLFSIGAPALSEAMCDYSSRAALLGTLGTHIGHELSHGYDFIGAQYDVTRSGPLFTEEGNAVFTEKAMAVADMLSRIESGNGIVLQGDKLITEAMADLTGVTLMLDLAKKEAGFDYDTFFRAFADFYFEYEYGYDARPDRLAGWNPHPPYHVRINFTVAFFDEFYQAYPSVTEGTPMYIAPEDRILVW
jgi:putative endopeptidase